MRTGRRVGVCVGVGVGGWVRPKLARYLCWLAFSVDALCAVGLARVDLGRQMSVCGLDSQITKRYVVGGVLA